MKDRRQFIKTLGRGVILTGLAGLSGALLLREDHGDARACDFDFICNNCGKRKTCRLPEAKEFQEKSTPKF